MSFNNTESQLYSLSRSKLLYSLSGAALFACSTLVFSSGGEASLIVGTALMGLSLVFAEQALSAHFSRDRLKRKHQVETETRQMQYNLADLRDGVQEACVEKAHQAVRVFLLHTKIV
ncbi:MAG: hypothetical protein S4CHLAM2_13450 [Chlamydiales bacterium]|nr:hypothetical protein [Chlamydiales bacterium]